MCKFITSFVLDSSSHSSCTGLGILADGILSRGFEQDMGNCVLEAASIISDLNLGKAFEVSKTI